MGYLDPGTGSSLAQALIAVFNKIGSCWRSFISLFIKRKN